MKSEEAFNKIYNHLIAILEMDAPELIRIFQKYRNIVIDDLEILDFLKNNCFGKGIHIRRITSPKGEPYLLISFSVEGVENIKKFEEWIDDTPRT